MTEQKTRFAEIINATGISALVFDMDGTLVHNMDYHRMAWLKWARREGLSLDEDELLSRTHGTIGEIVARLFPGEDEERLAARGARKEALYRLLYGPHLALLGGAAALLEAARARALPMAIATAADRVNIDFTLDGLAIRDYFSVVVGSNEVTHGKPHPEVFLRAATELGTAPGACLVVEDSPAGVEAARLAGMACLVVNAMAARAEFGDTSHVVHFADDYTDLL